MLAPLYRSVMVLLLVGCGGREVDSRADRHPDESSLSPDGGVSSGTAGGGTRTDTLPASWWTHGDTPETKPRWLLFPKPEANGYPSALLLRFDDLAAPSTVALGAEGQWLRGALWSPSGERLLYQLDDVELGSATKGGGLSLWMVDLANDPTPVQLDDELGLHYVESLDWLGDDVVFVEVRASDFTTKRGGYYLFDASSLGFSFLNEAPAPRNQNGATIPWVAASERGVLFPSGCTFKFVGRTSAEPIPLSRPTCGAQAKWAADATHFSLTNADGTWVYELTEDGPRELELTELALVDTEQQSTDEEAAAFEAPTFTWAPLGARFAGVLKPTDETLPSQVTVGDAATGELFTHSDPRRADYARWLSDGVLYVATPGYMSSRVFEVDDVGAELDLDVEYTGFRELGGELEDTLVASNAKVTRDGRSLLFTGSPAGIYEIDSLPEPPLRLTPDLAPFQVGGFSLSPDDEWLIFDTSASGEPYRRNLLHRGAAGEYVSLDEHPGLAGAHVQWAEFTPDGEGIICDAQRVLADGSSRELVIYIPLNSPADAYTLVDLPGYNGSRLVSVPDAWPAP